MWIFSGIPRGVPLPQSGSPSLRMATAQTDIMHQILLKAAEVADHTRKACQARSCKQWIALIADNRLRVLPAGSNTTPFLKSPPCSRTG
jgi:hypothetical protein